jgi:hypothetical protein
VGNTPWYMWLPTVTPPNNSVQGKPVYFNWLA